MKRSPSLHESSAAETSFSHSVPSSLAKEHNATSMQIYD